MLYLEQCCWLHQPSASAWAFFDGARQDHPHSCQRHNGGCARQPSNLPRAELAPARPSSVLILARLPVNFVEAQLDGCLEVPVCVVSLVLYFATMLFLSQNLKRSQLRELSPSVVLVHCTTVATFPLQQSSFYSLPLSANNSNPYRPKLHHYETPTGTPPCPGQQHALQLEGQAQTTLDCSFQDDLDVRGDGSLLVRRIINQADQTVSVELEYAGEGWLGFAFSELPVMVPNTAVIGLPDTGIVEKYDLTARALAGVMPAADSSSLTDHTITQADGVTILKFTKPLMEDGEVPVSAGEVRFNWAYGSSNTLGLHASRGSMVANFPECLEAGETAAPTAAPTSAVAAPTPGVVDLGDGRLQAILERQGGAVQMVLTTDEPAGTITVEMTYAGEAWIGFGFSENGLMPGSKAVIALPDSNTALQYDLNARNLNDVVPFSTQTLLDSSMLQEDGVTTLTFTKLLEEQGELPISLTDNSIFLYAIGFDNTLAVHQIREAVTLSATPTAAPTATPTVLTPGDNTSLEETSGAGCNSLSALTLLALIPVAAGFLV